MAAQGFGDHADIGEEVVDIGHQSPHDAKPCVVMGVHQAGHDNGAAGIDDFGIVSLDVCADRGNAIALYQDVAHRQVFGLGVHREDGAALEKRASCILRGHGPMPFRLWSGKARWPRVGLSLRNTLELSAIMSDTS